MVAKLRKVEGGGRRASARRHRSRSHITPRGSASQPALPEAEKERAGDKERADDAPKGKLAKKRTGRAASLILENSGASGLNEYSEDCPASSRRVQARLGRGTSTG